MKYKLLNKQTNQSLIEQIFDNRNISPSEINHYLNPTKEDENDPLLLDNMREGARALIKHIRSNDDMVIVVDCDADGYTSAATLLNYLNCLFPAYVNNHVSWIHHTGKEHGLADTVNQIAPWVGLVICPDSASGDFEQHAQLHNSNVDVLVLDHHECEQVSPNAIVINNQMSENYLNKTLCGAGVVYKFCQYIDSLLGVNYAPLQLDLVAVGLIADMVDLRDYETKYYINEGLSAITNPFLSELAKRNEYQIKGQLTPFKVSFYIAPYINGLIRFGSQKDKEILFRSLLDFEGYNLVPSTKRGCAGQQEMLAEQAVRVCVNTKRHQDDAKNKAIENIEALIAERNLLSNKILLIQLPEGMVKKNITGLVANGIMAKYQRPTLILNKTQHRGEDCWEGSMRAPGNTEIENWREWFNETGFNMYCQGHSCAAGFGMFDSQTANLINYANYDLEQFDFSFSYKVDAIYNANSLGEKVDEILGIASLNDIWGQGIEQPKFAIENVIINNNNIRLLSPDKSPTIRIDLPNGISCIKFKASQEEFEKLSPVLGGCIVINLVGTFERNEWNGNITPQILITDYKIVSNQSYYF